MYKFFVVENQIENEVIRITEDDVNHIKNVLRLEVGEEIEVCNITESMNYLCRIEEISSKEICCKIIEKLENNREAKVYLHIFQGLPKAEKMETIIQKTTEIGVCEITPVEMQRSIVKLDEKARKNKILRWRKIAEVAAKQSKRDRIPQINDVIPIKKLYEKIENYDIVFVAYEKEENNNIKEALNKLVRKNNLKIAVLIGPEGGIADEEIEKLQKRNVEIISLGKRILRTETAPIVLASIIMYELDEMV